MRRALGRATPFLRRSSASWASYVPPRASTGLLTTSAGPLRWSGWIDDTSWLAASHADAQRLVSQLPTSGAATNLFSDNVKTIAIGTELRLGRLHILNEPLYLLGSPLRRPGPGDFIRLLGRHALPHRFHCQALAKFMKAGRRTTAAVTELSLPSHYPISMYNGVAGGTQQWCAQVRPSWTVPCGWETSL